jgi:chromosome segregation ATPase
MGQEVYRLLRGKPEDICKSEIDLGLALFRSDQKVRELEATVKLQNEELDLRDRAIAGIRGSSSWFSSTGAIDKFQEELNKLRHSREAQSTSTVPFTDFDRVAREYEVAVRVRDAALSEIVDLRSKRDAMLENLRNSELELAKAREDLRQRDEKIATVTKERDLAIDGCQRQRAVISELEAQLRTIVPLAKYERLVHDCEAVGRARDAALSEIRDLRSNRDAIVEILRNCDLELSDIENRLPSWTD